jgi:large subunit ribosomal protein L4
MATKNVKIDVHTPAGKTDGSVELPAELFDVEPNIALMHQVVTAQLAAARQGTHSAKTRGEVRGGGRKPYRQKGTGRARQGSTRAPQFTGGGVVHGPKPRDYSERTPKKMIRAALLGALSDRARNGRIHAVTELVEGQAPSTKRAKTFLAGLVEGKQVLIVIGRSDEVGAKSVRNLPDVRVISPDQLNTYDVLVSDDVVFTEGALAVFLTGDKNLGQAVSALSAEPSGRPATVKKTAAATTKPAGEGVSDTEMAAEVAAQTSPDLKAAEAFEKAADKDTDAPAEQALADETPDTPTGDAE